MSVSSVAGSSSSALDCTLKGVIDRTAALAAILLLLPVFAAIALLVRLDSPGPVFHRRRVMGVNGSSFAALKFRTMVQDADRVLEADERLRAEFQRSYKLKQDPRVTRIGKLLRRSSLDELPQLVNVMAGQMSLVGPRMITAEELERYGSKAKDLLAVKPGITGPWQVGGRSDSSWSERVRLDLWYAGNRTMWLDIRILLRTIPAVLLGKGAY